MPVIATVADVGMDPAAGTTKPGKPRRRAGEVVVADAVVIANGNGISDNGADHTEGA